MAVERIAVNPVNWSLEMGFNQGEIVSGQTRTLYVSGQTAMSRKASPGTTTATSPRSWRCASTTWRPC